MTVQRGEIYFVNLNPVQGREQAGQRPVLVLSILNKSKILYVTVLGCSMPLSDQTKGKERDL